MPTVHVIGGPNGAGKSSLANQVLPAALRARFVNADSIAAGLSPLPSPSTPSTPSSPSSPSSPSPSPSSPSPPSTVAAAAARMQAGRLMLKQIRALASAAEDFAFESTLSSRLFIKFLRGLSRDGYQIHITYIYLHSVQLARRRVQGRVHCGGHDIPPRDIERRYRRSLRNFKNAYLPLADQWRVYDNSAGILRVIARADSAGLVISDQATWQQM